MKNPNNKYEKAMNCIDQLPHEKEFFAKEIQAATGISEGSLWSILPTLYKTGLLTRNRHGTQGFGYQKTSDWTLEKALNANYQRLKLKWQKYKSKPKQ